MASELSKTAPLGGRGIALRSAASEVGIAISDLAARFSTKFERMMRNLQLARMKSVLMNMNDEQLAQIGIKRSEISRYARTLTIDE